MPLKVFSDQADLESTLDRFDELVHVCGRGEISFAEFNRLYDNFYCAYALDGHESDISEQKLLAEYEARIALHRDVWEEVLTQVSSDEDAYTPAYIAAGRFGSEEAVARLKEILARHVSGTVRDRDTS